MTSMPRALALLGAVALAHAVYYRWPPGAERQWAFYVFEGAAFAVLCFLLRPATMRARASEAGALATGAAWWGVAEGLQQAVCGAIGWRSAASGLDMCVQAFGATPYVLGASALLACVITGAWRRQRGHNSN